MRHPDHSIFNAAGNAVSRRSRNIRGFSLVEILVTLAIFSIIVAGVFSAFTSQMKNTTREYRLAQTDIEFGVAKGILERDIHMAGYGLADEYGDYNDDTVVDFDPKAYQGSNGSGSNPDELKMMGTALGIRSRHSQGWTFLSAETPVTFGNWGDAREKIETGDRVILMEPSTKRLLTQEIGTTDFWLFQYMGDGTMVQTLNPPAPGVATFGSPTVGNLVYGLYAASSGSTYDDIGTLNPYYTVRYYMGGDDFPKICVSGTRSLLRAESVITETPSGTTGNAIPILSCVRDFQVAFGLDRDEDGTIETWDHGGATYINPSSPGIPYTRVNQRKRLKQVRVQILVQAGSKDPDYTYPLDTITVGDHTVTLTEAQKKYRWKLITMNLTPRNLR